MRISSASWKKYTDAHRALQDAARRELELYYDTLPWEEDEQHALALLMARAVELAERYGTADSTLSAGFYDEVMAAQGAKVRPAAVMSPVASFVAEDVRRGVGKATSRETAKTLASSSLSGHVKRAGVETMRTAAIRDRTQWAWVCIGDSCAFCRALGSNGWQDASRAVRDGQHAEHIHDNCDCQFVVRKPGESLEVEGYDPDALLDEYKDASDGGWRAKVNAMRREDYTPEFAAKRNARRRELYALAHPHDGNGTTSEQS